MAITVDDKAAVNVSLSPTNAGNTSRRVEVRRPDNSIAYGTVSNGVTTLDNGEAMQTGYRVDSADGNKSWYYVSEADGGQNKGVSLDQYNALMNQKRANQQYQDESYSAALYNNQLANAMDRFTQQTQQLYDQLAAKQKAETDYATQQAVNNLKRQWEDTRGAFEQERAKTAYSSAQAADNLALSRARAGDRGGIGNKQYSEQQNYYDQAILDIDLQQANLKDQIDRQVADYIAQGDYENARATYELGIAQMEQLINQQNQMLNYQIGVAATIDNLSLQADERAYQRALNNLQLGMFSPEDAVALGADPAQAQEVADRYKIMAQLDINAAQAALEQQYLKNAGYTAGSNKTGGGSGSGGGGGTKTGTSTAEEENVFRQLYNAGYADENDVYLWFLSNYLRGGKTAVTPEEAADLAARYFARAEAYDNEAINAMRATVNNPHTDDWVNVDGTVLTWDELTSLYASGQITSADRDDGTITYRFANTGTGYTPFGAQPDYSLPGGSYYTAGNGVNVPISGSDMLGIQAARERSEAQAGMAGGVDPLRTRQYVQVPK